METHVRPRDESLRPSVELEPTEHPLAIERAMEFHFEEFPSALAMTKRDRSLFFARIAGAA